MSASTTLNGSGLDTVTGPDWRLSFEASTRSVAFSSNNWIYNAPGLARQPPQQVAFTPERIAFRLCEGSCRNGEGQAVLNRDTGDINWNHIDVIGDDVFQTHVHGSCRPYTPERVF